MVLNRVRTAPIAIYHFYFKGRTWINFEKGVVHYTHEQVRERAKREPRTMPRNAEVHGRHELLLPHTRTKHELIVVDSAQRSFTTCSQSSCIYSRDARRRRHHRHASSSSGSHNFKRYWPSSHLPESFLEMLVFLTSM